VSIAELEPERGPVAPKAEQTVSVRVKGRCLVEVPRRVLDFFSAEISLHFNHHGIMESYHRRERSTRRSGMFFMLFKILVAIILNRSGVAVEK
jgi:hypothetical protein